MSGRPPSVCGAGSWIGFRSWAWTTMQTTRVSSKADLRIRILISRTPALVRDTAERPATTTFWPCNRDGTRRHKRRPHLIRNSQRVAPGHPRPEGPRRDAWLHHRCARVRRAVSSTCCQYLLLGTPAHCHMSPRVPVRGGQGVSIGSMWRTPLSELVDSYGNVQVCQGV